MKDYALIAVASMSSTLFGMLFFMHMRGYIIFYTSAQQQEEIAILSTCGTTKKQIALSFWRNGSMHSESHEMIWEASPAHNIRHIIASWLTLLHDEGIVSKRARVQSVALTADGAHAYVSFDRTFLPKQCSIHEKWHIIESLLHTLRDAQMPISEITFLVSHACMPDAQLDFSHPWQLTGYQ